MVSERPEVIAIVDDDLAMRNSLISLLSNYGYRAESYGSAADFLASAATTRAVCLLLDVQLGGTTGIELARQLAAAGRNFRIVFMTGSDSETFQRDAAAMGCKDYLRKPFPAERLMTAIRKALR